jgi:hypothetical protein
MKGHYILPIIALIFAVEGESLKIDEKPSSTPQMGWNSWNKFACNITEQLIKDTADSLVSSGLADLGYQYVNIDDCWQAEKRDLQGRVVTDPERFPSGMKAVADYIHSKGLKFGIYSSAGFKTCQGFPASLGLEEIDAATYAEWDVDYLKFDNCYQDHGPPEKRFSIMGEALTAATMESGREIFYSLCEWGKDNPAVWASGIGAGSWRISRDISDNWASIINKVEIAAPLWRYAGPSIGWNDPDMLEVGNGGCTDEEYKAHYSLWAMMKSPLIIGNDVRESTGVTASTMEILSNKEVIAVSQDPLGRSAKLVWSDRSEEAEGKLIAVKCATGLDSTYEDAPLDQQWVLQSDGTIQSASTRMCLQEGSLEGESIREVETAPHLVTTADCSVATRWDVGSFLGGSVVSRTSSRCLEVSRIEQEPLWQGKRIQTGICNEASKRRAPDLPLLIDSSEHQSWTAPNGVLKNLYQRQCLTVDRDAYSSTPSVLSDSEGKEVWVGPLIDGTMFSALLFNKAHFPQVITLTIDMLNTVVPSSTSTAQAYSLRDLWAHSDLLMRLRTDSDVKMLVPAHGVVMLKLTPV